MERIRYIDGDMPFDRDGQHATGREVAEWVYPTNGVQLVFRWRLDPVYFICAVHFVSHIICFHDIFLLRAVNVIMFIQYHMPSDNARTIFP